MENKNDAGTAGSKLLLAILIAITAIGPASTQFLLPAMPAIQADFGTTTATVQIALSGAFFALAYLFFFLFFPFVPTIRFRSKELLLCTVGAYQL